MSWEPAFFTVNEEGDRADTSKPSQQLNSIFLYLQETRKSCSLTLCYSESLLRKLPYLLLLLLEAVQPSKPEVNEAFSQTFLVMVSMQLGHSSLLLHPTDNVSYDKIVLCIRLPETR
ncbi:hypothetical protein MKW92_010598 [Papaver armeniacum]|nr:hypothetical protein MKW92_010598 [Papaver armeniacum]